MTELSPARILLVESDDGRSKRLQEALRDNAGYEVVVTPTAVGCLRELQASSFDLLVTNTTLQRERDSVKLIDILLVQGKVTNCPPVLVQSSDQDPALIKRFVQAGVIDYVLLPDSVDGLLPRIDKALAANSIGERLVGEAAVVLGPAARVLIEKGASTHLQLGGLQALRQEHLADLFTWIRTTVAPILKDKAAILMARLERAFSTPSRGT